MNGTLFYGRNLNVNIIIHKNARIHLIPFEYAYTEYFKKKIYLVGKSNCLLKYLTK